MQDTIMKLCIAWIMLITAITIYGKIGRSERESLVDAAPPRRKDADNFGDFFSGLLESDLQNEWQPWEVDSLYSVYRTRKARMACDEEDVSTK